MAEGRAPLLSSAEARARRTVLAMGAGVIGWLVGRQAIAWLVEVAISDPDAAGEWPELVRLLVYRGVVTGWVGVGLPPLGYVAGRYFRAQPWGFAVAAVIGGEIFAGLAQSVSLGAEGWLPTPGHVVAELVLLGLGAALTAVVGGRGLAAADRAQAAAQARADARAKELEAFTQQLGPASQPQPPPEATQPPADEKPPAS